MRRRGYPAEFRRRVLGLTEAGRSIATIAADLEISEQAIYTWPSRTSPCRRPPRARRPGSTTLAPPTSIALENGGRVFAATDGFAIEGTADLGTDGKRHFTCIFGKNRAFRSVDVGNVDGE